MSVVECVSYVYILLCSNGVLYTGSTRNLEARIADHNAGRGAALTRIAAPVELLWSELHPTHESALKRERQIKGWTRRKKWALIKGDLELLKRL